MKYLYLAEKPSAMKAVKAAYNASSKRLEILIFLPWPGISAACANQKNMKTGM